MFSDLRVISVCNAVSCQLLGVGDDTASGSASEVVTCIVRESWCLSTGSGIFLCFQHGSCPLIRNCFLISMLNLLSLFFFLREREAFHLLHFERCDMAIWNRWCLSVTEGFLLFYFSAQRLQLKKTAVQVAQLLTWDESGLGDCSPVESAWVVFFR